MRWLAVLVAMLTLAGCSTGPVEPSPARMALSRLAQDGFDHEPVLRITPVCYWCVSFREAPQYAMYADGTLVVLTRSNTMSSFDISDADLDFVAGLIEQAGLAEGGVHAAGTREGVADGSGVVFETVIDGTSTYVHGPFINPSDLDPEPDYQRANLTELLESMAEIVKTGSATDLTIRWVMIGRHDPSQTPTAVWQFEGVPTGDPSCLPFEAAELPGELAGLTNHASAEIKFKGNAYVMRGKPLLPHEDGCEDVQNHLNTMVVNDQSLDLGGAG